MSALRETITTGNHIGHHLNNMQLGLHTLKLIDSHHHNNATFETLNINSFFGCP